MPRRLQSFGHGGKYTMMDRLNGFLSARSIRKHFPNQADLRVCDVACGYNALLSRSLVGSVKHLTLVDLSINPDLAEHPEVSLVQGQLPGILTTLAGESFDVVLCYSILEHLDEPQQALDHIFRILKPEGICLINVPSWRGKGVLEWMAFRAGLSPFEEMEDHRTYYDVRDLWPMCVKAGFRPSRIKCKSHKFGFATFACCRR